MLLLPGRWMMTTLDAYVAERFGLTRGRQEALYRGGQVLKCCLFEPP